MSDRLIHEAGAKEYLAKRLQPLFALAESLGSVYDNVLDAVADHPKPGEPTRVGLILTARLANDIRICSMASQLGYGLQALSLCSVIIEVVGSLSYVGDSKTRAAAWAAHSDPRRTYPAKVSDGIDATLTMLGITNDFARENWRNAYQFMCQAKHANPYLSMIHGLRSFPTGAYYIRGPDSSTDLGIHMSAQALWNALSFGSAGTYIAAIHCADSQLRATLRRDSLTVRQRLFGLEAWFLAVIDLELSPTIRSEMEAAALRKDTQRLLEETKRLRLETTRLQRKTSATRRATERLRRHRR